MKQEISFAFGLNEIKDTAKLSTGLINHSYKITTIDGKQFLFQQINTKVFLDPMAIQENYFTIRNFLKHKHSFSLPNLIKTVNGELLYKENEETWRCFEYIPNTYSPLIASSAEEAYLVAKCFGKFSADLSDLDTATVKTILPGFHDLALRFDQFTTALNNASAERKASAKELLQNLEEHSYLLEYYKNVLSKPALYPLHILHHDCKIANILFYNTTNHIHSPIDLDTTQPGYFFSDIGDMIRSMAPNIPEDAKEINDMQLRTDFIEAINEGYLESMRAYLTTAEIQDLQFAGKIIIYMQALRYVADFLNNDIYYRISYPTQNKDRAANQLKLLQLLTAYTKNKTLVG